MNPLIRAGGRLVSFQSVVFDHFRRNLCNKCPFSNGLANWLCHFGLWKRGICLFVCHICLGGCHICLGGCRICLDGCRICLDGCHVCLGGCCIPMGNNFKKRGFCPFHDGKWSKRRDFHAIPRDGHDGVAERPGRRRNRPFLPVHNPLRCAGSCPTVCPLTTSSATSSRG